MPTQINPPIPVETPKGKGQAHFLIDYSLEQDLVWVVFLDQNGQCWSFRNSDIRAQQNLTIGRGKFVQEDTFRGAREAASVGAIVQSVVQSMPKGLSL